jgi:hypothetical protein
MILNVTRDVESEENLRSTFKICLEIVCEICENRVLGLKKNKDASEGLYIFFS